MIRKIIDLTKIFFVDYFQNLAIIDKKTNKVNRKSMFTWLILIVVVALSYISYQIIDLLGEIGQEQIFLNAYFLIMSIIIAFQTVLICSNVFYFSKDLEYVLPLPIKPVELLIAKFNTVLGMIYTFEAILGLPPLIIYGLMCSNLGYFVYLIPVLILFPIFICLVISTVMLFIMKLSKFIKNKDIFQVIIVLILTVFLTAFEISVMNSLFTNNEIGQENINDVNEENIDVSEEQALEEIRGIILGFNTKLTNANKFLLVANPSVNILSNPSFGSLLEFAKIIAIEAIAFVLFVFVGKITYLKNILKNVEKVSMNKKTKNHNLKNNYENKKVGVSYVLKEFKLLIKNPTFFMQCIFPIFVLLIAFIALANIMWPVILDAMKIEEMQEVASQLEFGIDFAGIILCIIQLLFTLSNISITAISRDGRNAMIMKYIPVPLYKQFIYKNLPQIIINTIVILTVLVTIHFLAPTVSILHLILLFVIAMLINIINSYLMVVVDLKRPNLNWDSEYVVMKQNNNKLFQYVTSIAVILFLMYFSKVCNNINLNIALILLMVIFAVILIITDKYVKINVVKLFKNIG